MKKNKKFDIRCSETGTLQASSWLHAKEFDLLKKLKRLRFSETDYKKIQFYNEEVLRLIETLGIELTPEQQGEINYYNKIKLQKDLQGLKRKVRRLRKRSHP